MIELERLNTHTLQVHSRGKSVKRILATALDAVDPAKAVSRHMQKDGSQIIIDGQNYNLEQFERVLLIGFGKASVPMGKTVVKILGDSLTGGLIIAKSQAESPHEQLAILTGAHPVPGRDDLQGGSEGGEPGAGAGPVPERATRRHHGGGERDSGRRHVEIA